MKHCLHTSLRALFLSLAVLLSLPMLAEVEIDGIFYDLNAETKEAAVWRSSYGYSDNVVIPETVMFYGTTYCVTSIEHNAFADCSALTSVTIPNTVTSIGEFAFDDCTGLTSMTIPNSVTSIGGRAFSGCSGLTSVIIGSGLESIGEYAFYDCSNIEKIELNCKYIGSWFSGKDSIKEIILGNNVESIGEYAFESCSGLTSVTIGNSVEIIGEYAFSCCRRMISVTIPNSVRTIRERAFSHCDALTSVTIPNSVDSIGDFAFIWCENLTSVSIPASVSYIGKQSFSWCGELASIEVDASNPYYDSRGGCNAIIETATNTIVAACANTNIPNNIKAIGYAAFCGSKYLETIEIPNSVAKIDTSAFIGCSKLISIEIPKGVESLEYLTFCRCSNLKNITIPGSLLNIGEGVFQECLALEEITLPSGLKSIGKNAFERCGITNITIPKSVDKIDKYIFCKTENLSSVVVESGNAVYDSREDCNAIIETATNTLLAGCKNSKIPHGVTTIADYAFITDSLTSITIPSSVNIIGDHAFYSCYNLENVFMQGVNPPTVTVAFNNYTTINVPRGSLATYQNANDWSNYTKIQEYNYYLLTVSSVGYATLFLDYNTEIPAGVEAYAVSEVVDGKVKMQKVEGVLPANTGVIIKAEAGTYAFAESNAPPAIVEKNMLKGSVEYQDITAEDGTSYYVLSAPGGIVAMYLAKITDGKFLNNAFKAYLPIRNGDLGIYDDEVDSGIEQLSRRLMFDFGEETSIDEVKTENGERKNVLYDLSGRRVQSAKKGIYIQNGRVVVK